MRQMEIFNNYVVQNSLLKFNLKLILTSEFAGLVFVTTILALGLYLIQNIML